MTLYGRPGYTLEVYPDPGSPSGGTYRLQDVYLRMETHPEPGNYSVLWSTDKGAIDSIDTALSVFGEHAFTIGAVAEKGSEEEGDAYGEGEVRDVIDYVREEADLRKLCYVRLGGPAVATIWSAPAKRFVDSTAATAELSMMVTGASPISVERMVSQTAISSIASRYHEAIAELRTAVPSLPQA